MFYTQGDYGLFQCGDPCNQKTYDNEELVRKMILAQGFQIETDGRLTVPAGAGIQMEVPSELVPRCPDCDKEMTVNLRGDDSFVEDAGWHQAAGRYADFIRRHENGNVLYLELGVGMNTPMLCSLRTRTTTTKALIKRRNSEHLQILTTNCEERRCA